MPAAWRSMVRCPRRVIVGVCITAAFAVAAAATGTGGVIQALKCKAALHSCSPSAAAEVPPDCRSQYASCAGRSVISVIVCIFLFMAAVASAMCTLSAWTHAHAQQPQQQDQVRYAAQPAHAGMQTACPGPGGCSVPAQCSWQRIAPSKTPGVRAVCRISLAASTYKQPPQTPAPACPECHPPTSLPPVCCPGPGDACKGCCSSAAGW